MIQNPSRRGLSSESSVKADWSKLGSISHTPGHYPHSTAATGYQLFWMFLPGRSCSKRAVQEADLVAIEILSSPVKALRWCFLWPEKSRRLVTGELLCSGPDGRQKGLKPYKFSTSQTWCLSSKVLSLSSSYCGLHRSVMLPRLQTIYGQLPLPHSITSLYSE